MHKMMVMNTPEERSTFPELMQKMQKAAEAVSKPQSGALELLGRDAQLREQVETQLKTLGAHSFVMVGCGKEAFVAKISDKQVVRISSCIEVEPLKIPQVLQPIFSTTLKSNHTHEGVRLEVLPYLERAQTITDEHKKAVCIAISKKGFYFTDPKLHTTDPSQQNVMLLPDGTPINVDREAASRTTDDPFVHEDRESFAQMKSPPYTWEGKQQQFYPEIATGEVVCYSQAATKFLSKKLANEAKGTTLGRE